MPVAFAPKDSASILLFHRVQFIWIFLALAGLAAKTLIYGYWISLDFLGFSRPNRELSKGYTEKPSKNFSAAPVPRRGQGQPTAEQCGCVGLFTSQD
jgi:hypothetical protein